tara:strand:- start:41 stop:499 length:459 start_codon:yes stop_codon:yes gene_type:complete
MTISSQDDGMGVTIQTIDETENIIVIPSSSNKFLLEASCSASMRSSGTTDLYTNATASWQINMQWRDSMSVPKGNTITLGMLRENGLAGEGGMKIQTSRTAACVVTGGSEMRLYIEDWTEANAIDVLLNGDTSTDANGDAAPTPICIITEYL